MATRLLPARLMPLRLLAPRLRGASSAVVGQIATHLAVQTQPGGAVSGVPLTQQPIIAALDDLEAVVTTFGGSITAVVSSGNASVIAGGTITAASGLGPYTGLTLALTGDEGLVTVTFSSGLLAITSATFFLSAAPVAALVLVDSPTRLTKMRRSAKTGDTTVITDTLQGYDRTPQDLTGATVVFTLVAPDGAEKILDREEVTILQSGQANVGKVSITIPASTAIPAGVSTFEFEASWDSGDTVLTFPDDVNAELVVIPQLG